MSQPSTEPIIQESSYSPGQVLVPEWKFGDIYFRVFKTAETVDYLPRIEAQFRFPAWKADQFVPSVDTQVFGHKCVELYKENQNLCAVIGNLVKGLEKCKGYLEFHGHCQETTDLIDIENLIELGKGVINE